MEREDRARIRARRELIYHPLRMTVTLIALVILAAVTVAVLRVAAMAATRMLAREVPALAIGSALVVVALVAGLVALAFEAGQSALVAISAVAGIGLLGFAWRGRPGFGRRRGLPPGSLSLRASLAALTERDFLTRSFDRYGPVFKMAQFHRPVVCVLGLERGREAIRANASSITPAPLGRDRTVPKGVVVSMAREDHAVYAPLLRAALAEVVSSRAREVCAPRAQEVCRALATTSGPRAPAFRDVVPDYVVPCLLELYFGSLLESGDRPVIDACFAHSGSFGPRGRPTPEAMASVSSFSELIRTRSEQASGATEVSYWSEIVRREPSAADDPTVLGNFCHLLVDARNNVSGAVTWTAWFLAQNPDWLAVVREGHDDAAPGRDPASAAVLETLRLARSEYVYRTVEKPITVDGFTIPAGWLLRVCVAESHRLDPPFEDPLRFDPERHLRNRFGPTEFAPFGLDAHGCLGARLTIELARNFVLALAEYELVIEELGSIRRGTRHWTHWSVGSDFRLALRPR